ncbi:MAG: ABC transporter substrate-binding protein [Campylobacterales bacterium]|nr:ABC transporter substrate-binding protein [Campylobacterales bacterium]
MLFKIICLIAFLTIFAFADELKHVKLQLRWLHQFQFAGYYMAVEKGFYKDMGLDVEIIEGFKKHSTTEVLEKRADFGVGNAGIVYERLNGKKVVSLATVFQHSPNIWLIRKDSNISYIEDLIGKKLMMTKTDENIELLAMFVNEGIPLDKLNIIESSYNLDDLIDRKVDAFNTYYSNEPFFLEQKGIEYTILQPHTYGMDFYSDCLFTSEEFLNKNPEVKKV